MEGFDIGQSDASGHLGGYPDFLADAVDQPKMTFGKHDGQGYAGKASARSDVENAGAGLEVDVLGDGQRMEHMMEIQVVDVLAGDDIDLRVPIAIKRVEGFKLLPLAGSECREIAEQVQFVDILETKLRFFVVTLRPNSNNND